MKTFMRFLPIGLIPLGLALLAVGVRWSHHPQVPVLLSKGYQSFVGVLMLLMQF
jgi:hypothetical protein